MCGFKVSASSPFIDVHVRVPVILLSLNFFFLTAALVKDVEYYEEGEHNEYHTSDSTKCNSNTLAHLRVIVGAMVNLDLFPARATLRLI